MFQIEIAGSRNDGLGHGGYCTENPQPVVLTMFMQCVTF